MYVRRYLFCLFQLQPLLSRARTQSYQRMAKVEQSPKSADTAEKESVGSSRTSTLDIDIYLLMFVDVCFACFNYNRYFLARGHSHTGGR